MSEDAGVSAAAPASHATSASPFADAPRPGMPGLAAASSPHSVTTTSPPKPPLGARRWNTVTSLVIAFAASQVLLLASALGAIPRAAGRATMNDVNLYGLWSRLLVDGTFPAHDSMWQYPPLAGVVFAASGWLPGPPGYGFLLLSTTCSVAIFALLLWAGRSLPDSRRLLPAWYWTVGALLLGPVLLTRFDVFPTIAAMIAVIAAARPLAAGASLAVGALLKVWPGLLILAWPRRDLGRMLAGFAAAGAGITAALWAWSGPESWSFLQGQSGRGLQAESLGGTAYLLAHALGFQVYTPYRFGSTEIDAPFAGLVAAAVTAVGVVLIGVIAWKRLRGKLDAVPVADAALALTCVFVATNRVFSPQFVIWLVGLGAVTLLDPRSRMQRPLAVVLGTALAGQLVYPMWYPALLDGQWYAVLAQCVRVALLVVATVMSLRRVLDPDGYAASGSWPANSEAKRSPATAELQSVSTHARPRSPITVRNSGSSSSSTARSATAAASPPGTT